MQLSKQFFSIDMSIRIIGENLNPKARPKWLDQEYPAILAEAKKEQAKNH